MTCLVLLMNEMAMGHAGDAPQKPQGSSDEICK
jgi:hypothetical protein